MLTADHGRIPRIHPDGDPAVRHLLAQLVFPDARLIQNNPVRREIIYDRPDKRPQRRRSQHHHAGELALRSLRIKLILHIPQIALDRTHLNKGPIQRRHSHTRAEE